MRDRQIALMFVRKKELRTARAQIAHDLGVNLRTVYRAIERELEWARKEIGATPGTEGAE